MLDDPMAVDVTGFVIPNIELKKKYLPMRSDKNVSASIVLVNAYSNLSLVSKITVRRLACSWLTSTSIVSPGLVSVLNLSSCG